VGRRGVSRFQRFTVSYYLASALDRFPLVYHGSVKAVNEIILIALCGKVIVKGKPYA
jgi:hypothetical protein